MIGREATRNPLELRLLAHAVESPPESGAAREPRQCGGLGDDRLADAEQRGPGGHPDAAGHEARGGVDVEVESRSPALARGTHLAPGIAMIVPGAGVRLVGGLVAGEADVAVNTEHRAFRVADDLGRDGAEPGVERLDESAHRLPHLALVHVAVLL